MKYGGISSSEFDKIINKGPPSQPKYLQTLEEDEINYDSERETAV